MAYPDAILRQPAVDRVVEGGGDLSMVGFLFIG
jgi:hypothetical protein